jgi:hemolysin III
MTGIQIPNPTGPASPDGLDLVCINHDGYFFPQFKFLPAGQESLMTSIPENSSPVKSPTGNRVEYWVDAVIHILGVLISLGATFGLVYVALTHPSDVAVLPLLAYCFGLIISFVFSAAYNMTVNPAPKAILRKFDRAAIFILIAGTYTPLGLLGMGGQWGTYLVTISWAIAIVGAVATLFFYEKIERLSLALYLIQGWLVIIAVKPMYDAISLFAFLMIIAGGLTYTAGVIFYHREDWKFNQAVWHTFVLGAAAIHYLAILNVANIA